MEKPQSMNRVVRDIARMSKSSYHRLRSIQVDGEFVNEVAEAFPYLALVANQRCGGWYVDPKKKIGDAYFKSTDGHTNQWKFSLRRFNASFARLAIEYGGCILVDSTRKGKRMPDALSKTVPIWCAVLNNAIHRLRKDPLGEKDHAWNCAFYAPPSLISSGERDQIAELIPKWTDELLASEIDLTFLADPDKGLQKPLRAIWIMPGSRMLDEPPSYHDPAIPFTPILCVCASEATQQVMERRDGYYYVQGAADDEEEWSLGLTAPVFWDHASSFSHSSPERCDALVREIVSGPKLGAKGAAGKSKSLASTPISVALEGMGISIGRRLSGKPPGCWTEYDAVLNCCHLEYEENTHDDFRERYLFLDIPEGKKGEKHLGKGIPLALQFVWENNLLGKCILIHCSQGKDRSVGIALSILLAFYDKDGALLHALPDGSLPLPPMPVLSKHDVQQRLLLLQDMHPLAAPTRETLKQVNRFFLPSLEG